MRHSGLINVAGIGMFAAVIYMTIGSGFFGQGRYYQFEWNLLKWPESKARIERQRERNDEAFRLADRNGSGFLELTEIAELYQKAGMPEPQLSLDTIAFGYDTGLELNLAQTIGTEALERAVAAYKDEGRQ